jgi:hypothetical protein
VADTPVFEAGGGPDTLRLSGVRKSYGVGTAVETEVLHGIDLVLRPGEFAAERPFACTSAAVVPEWPMPPNSSRRS